jgi:biopolymer transport protein TolR
MPYRPGKRRLMSEINVVPYIDVMLVLLIIFMVTAPLITQGVKVDLPQTVAEPIPPSENGPVVVNIDAEGHFYINYGDDQDQPVDPETLVNRIAALLKYQPGIAVLVGGDKDVPYGQVVSLMSTLQRAGVPSVGLMTVPEGGG